MGNERRQTKGRYSAREYREEGAIVKDWGGRLPIALVYPNKYSLGMSNLGVQAVYWLLNNNPKAVCERVFLDTKEKNAPAAIESGRPLTDFAVLAFSISYELDYFNVVQILKETGIPLLAMERDERYPLVIAGGPCVTANPMPLAPFFDAFCIGDAEMIMPGLMQILTESIGDKRETLLQNLAKIPGVYVPLHPPENKVIRQYLKNLDEFETRSVVVTPDTELGDSYLIEVERGCARGCRFCLVSGIYSPMRFRSAEKILEQARAGLKFRKRIGLLGPTVTDHPKINEILTGLNEMGAEIAISSLRIDTLTESIVKELARGKVQTITIAPEAGSQRLRDLIHKDINENDIFKAIDLIADKPFTQLKLYYVIGLPTETDKDIEEIIKLTLAIKDRLEQKGSQMRIVVNASPLVPKASTPFQWLPMAPQDVLTQRLDYLKNHLPQKGIKFNEESPAWSQAQAVLSRGDESVAAALMDMKKLSLAEWKRAAEQNNLDVDYFSNQRWDTSQKLPWAVIDTGVGVERLCGELEKAVGK
ncbi:MAG: radical SAM protein [Dehalococcoidales bacterium]|nr:radical SAM protein [Dehalococcoidales bacterium]